jgi:hypothetical protein
MSCIHCVKSRSCPSPFSYRVQSDGHGSLDDGYEFMAKNRTEEAFNAGCMINGYVPVTFEELRANNLRYHRENFSDKGESL